MGWTSNEKDLHFMTHFSKETIVFASPGYGIEVFDIGTFNVTLQESHHSVMGVFTDSICQGSNYMEVLCCPCTSLFSSLFHKGFKRIAWIKNSTYTQFGFIRVSTPTNVLWPQTSAQHDLNKAITKINNAACRAGSFTKPQTLNCLSSIGWEYLAIWMGL